MQSQLTRPGRICIVAQFNFSSQQEDVQYSSAFALAQHLAARGEVVTFLLAPAPTGGEPPPDMVESLRAAFLQNWLVHLTVLTASPDIHPGLDQAAKCSLSLYHHLRENPYDMVYVSLQGGLPHFPVTAKKTGVFKSPPPIAVLAYEPLLWKNDAERRSLQHKDDLTVSFMEKVSVEQCDCVIAQCESVVDWMKARGWHLPRRTHVLSPLVRRDWHSRRTDSMSTPTRELVHIGNGELGNDLALFCDAIDKLLPSLQHDSCITFLGPFGKIDGEHSGGLILRRSANWPVRIKMLPFAGSHEILDYITARPCLVVFSCRQAQIPLYLLACLHGKVPFISTDVGGVSSLIESSGREAVLCKPDARGIASKIADKLRASASEAAAPAMNYQELMGAWDAFHRMLLNSTSAAASPAGGSGLPLVSIVLAHYNRPEHLRSAIASIERQDYSNIEVILVDDGSTRPAAIKALAEIEETFAASGWRVIRQPNQYLGAARNTGVRSARGERILFMDDDNLLFPSAVRTLVEAMERSGADICTALSRYVYDQKYVPADTSWGRIEYLPVGGPADMALFNNPYGDANALIRRDVFNTIGYLNETRGLSASDWEFFLRADLAGLKIVVVPEAVYWYRSDPEGMNRNVNWIGDRRQLINAFGNRDIPSTLGLLLELSVFQNLDWNEKSKNEWNLAFRVNDPGYRQLTEGEPGSSENIERLSLIAARSGRPDTAIELIAVNNNAGFLQQADSIVGAYFDRGMTEADQLLLKEAVIPFHKLKQAHVFPSAGRMPVSYTQSPDGFHLEVFENSSSVAVLKSICPAGTISASAWAFSPEELAAPLEFMLSLIPEGVDPTSAADHGSAAATDGCSGWVRISWPRSSSQVHAALSRPAVTPLSLVMAVRWPQQEAQANGGRSAIVAFQGLAYRQGVDGESIRHPRTAPPRDKQPPRALTNAELDTAIVKSTYQTELPLLLFDRAGGGLFTRPHPQGPVVVLLPDLFPPHATSVSAFVEIAHEEASPFEFGLALLGQGEELQVSRGNPVNAASFSGWTLVSEKFELREIRASVRTISPEYMSIYLMIRLPRGSSPSPANAFWRRVILRWGE